MPSCNEHTYDCSAGIVRGRRWKTDLLLIKRPYDVELHFLLSEKKSLRTCDKDSVASRLRRRPCHVSISAFAWLSPSWQCPLARIPPAPTCISAAETPSAYGSPSADCLFASRSVLRNLSPMHAFAAMRAQCVAAQSGCPDPGTDGQAQSCRCSKPSCAAGASQPGQIS